jgi:hypothetical protein
MLVNLEHVLHTQLNNEQRFCRQIPISRSEHINSGNNLQLTNPGTWNRSQPYTAIARPAKPPL